MLFEGATSAKVNWEKSERLIMGRWVRAGSPSLPGVLQNVFGDLRISGEKLGGDGGPGCG
jgi:hypothetical protein